MYPGWSNLKDFSTVQYNGKKLVYGSFFSTSSKSYGSFGTSLFNNWSELSSAAQTQTNGFNAVAPTLFYFKPKDIWVLGKKHPSPNYT